MLPSGPSAMAVAPPSIPGTATPVVVAGATGGIFAIASLPPPGVWLTQMKPSAAVMPPVGKPTWFPRSAPASTTAVPSGATRPTDPSSETQTFPSGPTVSWPLVCTFGRSKTPLTAGAPSAAAAGSARRARPSDRNRKALIERA